ncbi:hypothetical protein TTRE_0000662601 [Trichuris trichiura]|uniref:Uncharacterized protein n=1 Tax=Trichuris trichiura TaxID=36087 RepID=A0A077ZER0_TRITR|nr:hypothetical protein TTRE_0000662601 [Trichuris trichiura]
MVYPQNTDFSGQETVHVEKLFQVLVKLKKVEEAVKEVESFISKGDKLGEFSRIVDQILDTLLAKVPCQHETAVFAKKCYDILTLKDDVSLDVKEKYAKYILEKVPGKTVQCLTGRQSMAKTCLILSPLSLNLHGKVALSLAGPEWYKLLLKQGWGTSGPRDHFPPMR